MVPIEAPYVALALLRNTRRIVAPLKSLILLAMAVVAGARPQPTTSRRSSSSGGGHQHHRTTSNKTSYNGFLLSFIVIGILCATVIPGALAVDPGNKRLADNELRNDRQAPAAGGLNPMAPGVPTGLPGAGGVPLLPAGLNNNPAGAPVNNTAAPAGTVHFAANGGPLQTPIAPPFNQPMQVQPNHMQMLQMLQMMLAQAQGHNPYQNQQTPQVLTTAHTPVPFQGFGTVTPLPTGAINIQVPPAAIPIHQQLLPDPAAAGPSDPGQWGWKCAVTDQDIVQYEQLKLDLDTYMADCVNKSIMCPKCSCVWLGNETQKPKWKNNHMRWLEIGSPDEIQDFPGVKECPHNINMVETKSIEAKRSKPASHKVRVCVSCSPITAV